jgi:hypothetical protein
MTEEQHVFGGVRASILDEETGHTDWEFCNFLLPLQENAVAVSTDRPSFKILPSLSSYLSMLHNR